MPAKKLCGGRYTRESAIAEATTAKSTLEDIATAASDFPDIFFDEGFSEQSALELALDQARKKAEEWCRTRKCEKGKCHYDDVDPLDYNIISVDKNSVPFKGANLDFYKVVINLNSITCRCKDTQPIIVRKKKDKQHSVVTLKDEMKEAGLTPKQIDRIDKSKCEVRRFAMRKEKGPDGKEQIDICAKCGHGACKLGEECTLILYKIGDDNDKGVVQKYPYVLTSLPGGVESLPEGHFLLCECR